jgi:hypothetical protein
MEERCQGRREKGYGSVPEEVTKRKSKRGSTRSDDGRAIKAGEQRSEWISDGSYGGARWCADRVNLNAPPRDPLLHPQRWSPSPLRASQIVWATPLERGLGHTLIWVTLNLVAGLISFKETGPLLLLYLLIFYFISLV